MKSRTLALIHSGALICAVLTAGCSETQFPTTPAPVANVAPVVNLSGANYQGSITLANGTATSFNMTLIARGLGVTTRQVTAAQAPGTVEITGSFETGSGLSGSVRGMLEGTLENGRFQGNLDLPDCTRGYAGPMTDSGFAWTPSGDPVPGCPLTFVIQIPRPLGPGCTYAASPSRSSFSGNGGTATVNIGAGDRCAWAAESLVPWISIADPATGTGAGTITFTVGSNSGSGRQGTMRVAGHTIGISQGPECKYSVVPSTTSVRGSGGTGSINVTAPEGCEWTASSSVDWLTLSASSGAGNGVLTFTAKPNSGPARQGTLQVAGQSVTITQEPGCSFSVTPANVSVPAAGGSGTIAITGPAGCGWAAQSGEPWVTLSPATGSGNGTVTFTAQRNTGPQRQATLQVAGRSVIVTQAGECVYSISPPNAAFTPTGGPGNVAVTAGSDCNWTATSNANEPWLQVTSGASGQGNGTVSYGVQANAGAERIGTLLIAGQTFTVTQAAAACVFLIKPQNATSGEAGGPGSVAVATRSDCNWTATSMASWIRVTAGASGQGNGTVSYAVDANPSFPSGRTGTILIGDQLFTVTQDRCLSCG